MNLKAYLANIGMSFRDFGRLVECHPYYLAQISSGKMLPSKRLAREIEKATDGEIKIKASEKINGRLKGIKLCDCCKKNILIKSVENIPLDE